MRRVRRYRMKPLQQEAVNPFPLVYNPRMRKLRLLLALVVLLISLAVLAWGLWPAAHERRTLTVPPGEMALPTPTSFEPSTVAALLAGYAPEMVSWHAASSLPAA